MQTKLLAVLLAIQCYHLEVRALAVGTVDAPAKHRIVGGRDGSIEDFPFQLSLRRNAVHICGAAVLDSVWALTAAHCVDGFEHMARMFTLRMGSTSRLSGGSVISVTDIYSHPAYNSENMNYDVALLRVEANKLRGDFVEPIKLPTVEQSITDDVAAIVSGWGHMSSTENVLSSVLKYTTVYTVNQQRCDENLRDHGGITAAMFCAAARDSDACQGDSGGPIQNNGTLIGVVSWGVGCADPYYPGVYTRLAYAPIRSWLRLIAKL